MQLRTIKRIISEANRIMGQVKRIVAQAKRFVGVALAVVTVALVVGAIVSVIDDPKMQVLLIAGFLGIAGIVFGIAKSPAETPTEKEERERMSREELRQEPMPWPYYFVYGGFALFVLSVVGFTGTSFL
jgi:hypothetical protein